MAEKLRSKKLCRNGLGELCDCGNSDVTHDFFVGEAGLTMVITNWGKQNATHEEGDVSGDGMVGGVDYNAVLTYWGRSDCLG